MALTLDKLKNDVTNKIYNSSSFKAITGQDWISTSYGNNIIPEYTKTDTQKRYMTSASIPNLPKPETMFFVYFNLNSKAQLLINKKRELIEYLSKLSAQQNNTELNYQESVKQNNSDNIINYVSNTIDSYTTEISNQFEYAKKSISNSIANQLNITTNSELKTSADYIPDKIILRQLSFELSKFVKSIEKPTIQYTIKEYNEYNRKRLCYDSRQYNPIKITFYDVKENPVQQFFFSYLKLIDDTFLCKTSSDYKKQIQTNNYNIDYTDWGFNVDSNFRLIDSISIIEMYMDRIMVYTLENPVLETISFGTNNIGSFKANEISVSFKYEGITNDLLVGESASPIEPYTNVLDKSNDKAYLKSMINSKINPDIAEFLQMRYKNGTAFGIDNAMAFIKGILDTPSDERWDKFKSQLLDTGRKLGFADEINTLIKANETIDNFQNSNNQGKYLFKVTDDPTSIIGTLTASNITSASNSILNLF